MPRSYTGWDKDATGKRAGAEALSQCLEAYFGLWNNGTWGIRSKRGKESPSVHGTGRAGDNSWRGAPYRGTGNYDSAKAACDFLVEHADELGLEFLCDYYPPPHGRGWMCTRESWQDYPKHTVSGAPQGDWIHWELDNAAADDPARIIKVFEDALGAAPAKVKEESKKTAKAPEGKKPWLQVGSKGEQVKKVQQVVGAKVDGDYGKQTEAAVKAWQAKCDMLVDGIVGPETWKRIEQGYEEMVSNNTKPEVHAQSVSATDYPGSPIKLGDRSEAVKLVQKVVGATQDGWYGKASQRRVMQWQRSNNLTVDGVVGPKTWAKMFG